MKLYIWKDPYPVDYGAAIIYAIAESEDEARAIAMRAPICAYGDPPRNAATAPHSFTLGKPDRVMDVPYAEIYEWSE